MSKVRIKLIAIGHLPIDFQADKIMRWKSSIFEIVGNFEELALRCNSDGKDWEFSDQQVQTQLPESLGADFMIAIVNVPLEDNFYARRPGNNQIVFTFYQIKEILQSSNIPIENAIYRLLYTFTLLFKSSGNKIPDFNSAAQFTHDETRGCVFDMNGIKGDLVASCHKPVVCGECREKLNQRKVSALVINSAEREIKRIRRDLYYRVLSLIRKYPVWSVILSGTVALIIGILGSFIASVLYERFKDYL